MSPLWLGLAYYCKSRKYTANNKVFSQGYSLFQLIAKMILSNTERKKLFDILISICILYFIDISGFGTYSEFFSYFFLPQYIVTTP